jgi:hypothetical protein
MYCLMSKFGKENMDVRKLGRAVASDIPYKVIDKLARFELQLCTLNVQTAELLCRRNVQKSSASNRYRAALQAVTQQLPRFKP